MICVVRHLCLHATHACIYIKMTLMYIFTARTHFTYTLCVSVARSIKYTVYMRITACARR